MNSALQFLIDALSVGSLYALAALGVGLVFGVLRLVNFAYGDFITVGSYALIVPSASITAIVFIGNWPWPLLVIASRDYRRDRRADLRISGFSPAAPGAAGGVDDRIFRGGLHYPERHHHHLHRAAQGDRDLAGSD